MKVDQLRRFAPVAIPLAIVAIAWLIFVQPRRAAAARASAEIQSLQPRLAEISPLAGGAGVPTDGDVGAEIIRRLPEVDPMPDVLERLARLALVGAEEGDAQHRVTDLLIETGEQALTSGEEAGQPTATGAGDDVDPRVALFGVPLGYTRVVVSFESSYERLGKFLWDMRELPTIVEVHTLDVQPSTADRARVRTSMVLFVYRRMGAPA